MAPPNGIHDSRAILLAALRALAAASYGGDIVGQDLDAMRRYAPDLAPLAVDDFAREVVKRVTLARSRALQKAV